MCLKVAWEVVVAFRRCQIVLDTDMLDLNETRRAEILTMRDEVCSDL